MSVPDARAETPSPAHVGRSAVLPILVLTLVWGCNWPVFKLGLAELSPLTFRALTLPLAALGMFLASRWSGESIRIPRAWWGRVALLALFNIGGWNGSDSGGPGAGPGQSGWETRSHQTFDDWHRRAHDPTLPPTDPTGRPTGA